MFLLPIQFCTPLHASLFFFLIAHSLTFLSYSQFVQVSSSYKSFCSQEKQEIIPPLPRFLEPLSPPRINTQFDDDELLFEENLSEEHASEELASEELASEKFFSSNISAAPPIVTFDNVFENANFSAPQRIIVPISECFVDIPSSFPKDASLDNKFVWLTQRKNVTMQLYSANPYYFSKHNFASNMITSKKLLIISMLSKCFSSLIGSFKCWFGFHNTAGPNRSSIIKNFEGIQIIYFDSMEINSFDSMEQMIPFFKQNIFERLNELGLQITMDQIESNLIVPEQKIKFMGDIRERAPRASKPVVRFEPVISIPKERKRKLIIPDEEFGAETDDETTFLSAVEKLNRVDAVASVQIDKAIEKEIPIISSDSPIMPIYAPSPVLPPELPPIYGMVGIPYFDDVKYDIVSGGLDIIAMPKAKKPRVAPTGTRREAILSTLTPKTSWINSIEGELWIHAWKIFFCARSSYSTSKEIIAMHKSNKSMGFEIARTTEIIQHIISKTKDDDLIFHGIMLSMFFKMIYCLDLQPASCPTDAYVSPLVNSRKLGSERRPSDSLKPIKEKCFGLALPRANVNKRSKADTDAHADELKFLADAINTILEIAISDNMVPAQHIVISTISAILNKYQPYQLKPFGYCVGSCWTYLPEDCDLNVWADIQYIGRIVATYASCVRKGAVMGTIVGDLGYQMGQFLPPFLGPESDYVGDSARGDAALNRVMYGDMAPPPQPHDYILEAFAPQEQIDI